MLLSAGRASGVVACVSCEHPVDSGVALGRPRTPVQVGVSVGSTHDASPSNMNEVEFALLDEAIDVGSRDTEVSRDVAYAKGRRHNIQDCTHIYMSVHECCLRLDLSQVNKSDG